MMKMLRVFIVGLIAFCAVSVRAASYIDTEQKYFFHADNIIETFTKFITDETKREECGDLYIQLMDAENGQVGIADLFAVCRQAGFNTYRESGYTKCREMIVSLTNLEQSDMDTSIMSGFCPGLDEKGKNPNKLQTITDKTRIGDFCKSINISGGEVVFKKGYNCTCMAYACNSGYEFKGGACNKIVADGQGNCLRQEYPRTNQNDTIEELVAFCGTKAAANKCKYNAVLLSKDNNKVICNPTPAEQDAKRNEYEEAEAANRATIDALPYKEVCGKDKGKTGGEEHCVDNVFNWVNVGMIQAVALAKEYALIRDNKVIHCSDKYRTSWNDDYVKCVTEDKKTFYEFKFDDVKESVDSVIEYQVISGICKIHNLQNWAVSMTNYTGCLGHCSEALKKTAVKFGITTRDTNGACALEHRRLGKKDQDKLAKIDGIDNKIFYHGIQVQGSQAIIRKLRDYIASLGKYTIKTFNCDNNVGKIDNGIFEKDDVLRCYLNGQPIDFVFDDISETWETYHKGGMQGIDCIVSGGTYSGKGCLGLDKTKCDAVRKLNAATCPECQRAYYDDNLQQCLLPSSASATNLEKGVKLGTIVAGATVSTIITVATGGAGALMVVELAGSAIELAATAKMQQEAQKFLNASNVCKDASCAEQMIKTNLQRLANLQSEFTGAEANAIDSEMARLFKLVPANSFQSSKLSDNQLSMFDIRSWEPEQIWRAVGFVAQMASTIASIGGWIKGKFIKTNQVILEKLDDAANAASSANKALLQGASTGQPVTSSGFQLLDKTDEALDMANTLVNTADDALSAAASGADNVASWADDLASIGVKKVDGIYTDIQTGAKLSAAQVANRIPSSLNDELAKIGIKQIDVGKSGTRYISTATGQFVSSDDVVKLIDNMPSASATNAVVSSADNVADSGRALLKSSSTGKPSLIGGQLVFENADEVVDAAKTAASNADNVIEHTDDIIDAASAAENTISASNTVRQGSIKMTKADEDLILDAIIKRQNGTLSQGEHLRAVQTLEKYFDENAARQFAQQMRNDLVNLFGPNTDLSVFDNGVSFGQYIVDGLSSKYGVNGLRVEVASNFPGYAMYKSSARTIYLNPAYIDVKAAIKGDLGQAKVTFDQLANLVTHEFVHAIDDIAPQNGVIGHMLNVYGDALYSSTGEIYKLIPTERGAHMVSDIVSGMGNYGTTDLGTRVTEIIADRIVP